MESTAVGAPAPNPRRKGDKRERTRAHILEVARQLVEERGYDQATVQEVARRAGLSNGAVYGNFRNRDDLFAALGPTYWPRVRADVAPGATFAEAMEAVAEALIAALPARAQAGPDRLTGLAYTLANPGLQAKGEEEARARFAAASAWWKVKFPDERALPMPPETLVRVIGALIEGLTLQRLLTPDLMPDHVIRAAFAALVPGPAGGDEAARRAPPTSAS